MLQQLVGGGGRADSYGWVWLTLAVVAVGTATSSCGPVEPEPLDNGPPYIGEVDPPQPVRSVQGENTELPLTALKLYDPNREEGGLHVAWMSDVDDAPLISTTTTDRLGETTLQKRRYYLYDTVSETIDPCELKADGSPPSGRMTIWLYVSDRDLDIDNKEGSVTPAEGGFLVSHTWVIKYLCVDS